MKLREPWKRYIGGKILTLRLISFVLLLSLLTPRGVIVFTAYSESYRRIRDAGSFTNAAVFFEDLVKLPPDQAKKIAGTKMYEAALMLAIMKEHALDGFVVSGEASIKFIKSNRDMDYRVDGERVGDLAIFIKEKLGNLDTMVPQDIERISQQIREAVNNAKLPEALKQEIRNKYGILSNREGYPNLDLPVAVRSAGILEDLPFDVGSAAGRHDTYLNVKGQDEVVARYQNDVASLYTARAIGYRDYQIIFSFMQALGREGVSRLVNKLKSDAGGQWTKDVIEAIGDFDHPQLLKVSSYRIAKVLERNNLQEELDILNREKDAYINPEKLAISVGVMTMGNFDSSYVIFGAEPNSGWTAMSFQEIQPNEYFNKGRVFIVTVNYKLGEAIVQGMVTPDRYLVHVFRDKNGKQHVNILEKTLGNKGIQVVYVDELLAAVGLNKDESLEVTEALKTYRIQHSAQGIKLSERVKSLIFKNPATPPLEAFFDALNRLAEVREDMAEEVKIDQTLLSQLKINQTQLIQLAHLAKKFLKDPKSGVVNTFVPKEMRVRFSNFDYQVMDTIEQVAMKLAENYNNIIDIEGGRGNVRNILDNPVSVQRRPLTSQLDIKSPNVLNLTRTVIDEERLEELQKSKIQLAKGIYAGQIIGQGVKGRNAFSGRIFHIDESKGPLEAQFAQATQYASQLESQNEKMIIFTRETTPDYEPVMKLSTGGMSLIGSDTSHAAIISRELKIAWVVGMQTYFEELKRNKPEEYENIINYLQTPGALVTVDANNGIVYAGRVPIKEERVDIQINRLPKVSTKIGLIIGLPQLMRELSKLTQYESSYDISLQRMEFIFAAMGIYPRAGLAYDNLLIWNYLKTRQDPSYKSKLSEIERLALSRLEMDLALRAQAREQLRKKGLDPLQKFPLSEIEEKIKIGNVGAFESGLDKYAKADMEILRNGSKESRDVLRKIYYKTEGFISFGEYYDQFVGGAVGGMAAASSLDGTVAVRSLDFKLNESISNLIGADLFHKREPATMIGERGARWALKPENLKTLKKEIKMILTQVKNGYENIAYFFPFVSTPEELDALFTILEEEEKNMGVYLKKIGMMTELPSNIILADEFAQVMAKHVQKVRAEAGIERKIFFSFGTNDLTQTTFRYDRDDPAWKERFQEGSKEIIASIKHVVAVAKKNGIETGLCGQAIVKLLQTDPETAEEIIALLGSTGGSTGVDYLGYADAVARAASADLHNGSISQQEASKAHVLAEGVSSIKKGAASRPLYKFDDSYIGDFVLVDRVFDLNDPATRAKLVRIGTFIGTSQMIEQFKTNIQRAIQAAQGLSDEKTKVALLTTLRSIERIPTFVVSPTVYSSLNREKAGTVITIDFERDKIYSGKIPIVIKVDLTDPLEIPSVRGKPAEMKVSLISASEIYKSDALSKLHPLNFVYYAKGKHIDPTARRRIDGMLRDRKLTSAERLYITIIKEQILKRQQVTPGGVKLVYATADMNSWDLAQLDYPLETPAQNEVVNPPIAYGGLARLVDDKLEYKTLLKWEFQAIKELKDEGFDIALQFNDVREALYLEKAIGLLQNIGLDSIEIGMDITTPTNYLFPKDFMKYLSFINIDETKLGIAFLAADILGNPRVAEAYPPEVIRKNIQKVINILTLAAEQNRIKLALNIGSKP